MDAGGAGEVRHWNADVNGISLHVAEQGPADGPAVLLLHGFPELWLSWRHQMVALAARGFRALAPDLRGYGDSSAPADPAAYSIFHIAGDIVALLDHVRLPKVFVVGHDWGAQVAWHLCLFRPDRVRALIALAVPFFPRPPVPTTDAFAARGDGFYITQFQNDEAFLYFCCWIVSDRAGRQARMEVRHWNADVNGISLHVAEQGPANGPAVLLLHGFPELWLSWRHQMAALAARGFRAIAPDLRGYGDSDAPSDPAAYSIFHIVGDLVALLDHIGLPKVLVVGHDWGALVAWHLSLFRPDLVRAVLNIGVPYFPRGPSPTTESFAPIGDGFYILQFQEPGRAEKAFGRYDVATVLKKLYSTEMDELVAPPGVELIDFLQAPSSPLPWLTDEELGQYAEKFQKSGFTGPLNYYRMLDTNWRLTSPWQGAKITVPAKFILADKDIGFKSFGIEQYVKSGGLKSSVPDLEVAIIEGHHFLQQEQPERVNSEIFSFLDKFTTTKNEEES